MITRPKRISTNVSLPVSYQEAADYLRSDADENSPEGRVIKKAILAARDRVQAYIDGVLLETEYEWKLSGWWNGALTIPVRPFRSLVSLSYRDESGQVVTIEDTDYDVLDVDSSTASLQYGLKTYPKLGENPRNGDVLLRFKAGYASADEIPQDLIHAMLLFISAAFDERQDTIDEKTRLSETLMDLHKWPVIA